MADWPELYILRHGQTEWNAEGRMQGSLNSPLTELGRRQAAAQHRILAEQDLTGFAAFASPQGRAFHTAGIALDGLMSPIRTDDRLVEITVGDWEGKNREALGLTEAVDEAEHVILSHYDRAPGGEGFAALHARCLSFLQELSGPAVLVTHGMTSRMLRVILLGQGIDQIGHLPGGQGVVYHLAKGVQQRLG